MAFWIIETSFFQTCLMSIHASMLLPPLLLLRFCVRRKASKSQLCVLWSLIAILLVCPPIILSVPTFNSKEIITVLASDRTRDNHRQIGRNYLNNNIAEEVSETNLYCETKPSYETVKDRKTIITSEDDSIHMNAERIEMFSIDKTFSSMILNLTIELSRIDRLVDSILKEPCRLFLGGFWLTGVVVMLLFAALSYYHVLVSVRASLPVLEGLWKCDRISSPFILGIIKPHIYIPSGLSDKTLRHVTAHERAHLRRKDHWWKPIGYLLLSIHWFNPLIWISYAFLCRDIELACDEAVTREMEQDERADYVQALLDCASRRRMVTVCPLSFGEIGVKARVTATLSYHKPARSTVILLVIAIVFFGMADAVFLINTDYLKGAVTLAEVYRRITPKEISPNVVSNLQLDILNGDSWHMRERNDDIVRLCSSLNQLLSENSVKSTDIDLVASDVSEAELLLSFNLSGIQAAIAYTSGRPMCLKFNSPNSFGLLCDLCWLVENNDLESLILDMAGEYDFSKQALTTSTLDSVPIEYTPGTDSRQSANDTLTLELYPELYVEQAVTQAENQINSRSYVAAFLEQGYMMTCHNLSDARKVVDTSIVPYQPLTVFDFYPDGEASYFEFFQEFTLEEYPEVVLICSQNGVAVETHGWSTAINGFPIWNGILCDVTGDCVRDLCCTLRTENGASQIVVIDTVQKHTYTLGGDNDNYDYVLYHGLGAIRILYNYDVDGDILIAHGVPAVRDGELIFDRDSFTLTTPQTLSTYLRFRKNATQSGKPFHQYSFNKSNQRDVERILTWMMKNVAFDSLNNVKAAYSKEMQTLADNCEDAVCCLCRNFLKGKYNDDEQRLMWEILCTLIGKEIPDISKSEMNGVSGAGDWILFWLEKALSEMENSEWWMREYRPYTYGVLGKLGLI